jgi:hypothetical protein
MTASGSLMRTCLTDAPAPAADYSTCKPKRQERPTCSRNAIFRHFSYQATLAPVAHNLPGVVAVRDTKDREGPALVFEPDAWRVPAAASETANSTCHGGGRAHHRSERASLTP